MIKLQATAMRQPFFINCVIRQLHFLSFLGIINMQNLSACKAIALFLVVLSNSCLLGLKKLSGMAQKPTENAKLKLTVTDGCLDLVQYTVWAVRSTGENFLTLKRTLV